MDDLDEYGDTAEFATEKRISGTRNKEIDVDSPNAHWLGFNIFQKGSA